MSSPRDVRRGIRRSAVLGAAMALLYGVVSPAALAFTGAASGPTDTAQSNRVGNQMPIGVAPTVDGRGFWVASANGLVTPEGDATSYGDVSAVPLNAPLVSIAATASGHGYWLLARDGGIFTFGDAAFYGSTGNIRLNAPIVGMAATPSGQGYWLVATDGGIFTFGDAAFYGSTGNIGLNAPIADMAATRTGHGYWLVASDGGIFTFGDATFRGSTGNVRLNAAIVAMATTSTGNGYSLVASDGGIFTFGDAAFYGSAGGSPLPFPVIGMVATGDGRGYWLVLGNGQVGAFGDAAAIVTAPILSAAACAGNPPGARLLVVSVSQQQLWACEGSQVVAASAVTTGKFIAPRGVNHSTPIGTWHVVNKQTTRFLNGCDANGCWHEYVNFWMPYDGNVGIHDAPWQTFPFGSPLYATQGSEGCVRLPEDVMSWVYAWAPVGTTVTVHR